MAVAGKRLAGFGRKKFGVPSGSRTRVSAVKGRRPGPLDDGDLKTNCEGRTKGTDGEPCRTRTYDPLLKRQTLYRLS